ncbi:adhesion G-protein coupled receptor G2-like [Puntigrus tetrazona]|uniref:adhesion G-protein coupled receptor G2-like n=1 Tax=Puntigrus tetrazona TaxID=1606681 RepID=UPI001C89EC2E|nr:adhesion G-protein coupled receptor G2-like [Puntigrus tetrazona]
MSNSSLHTLTPEPSTTFTSNTTTPKQTTSFTSLTTFLNQTSSFPSQLVTPESTVTSTSDTLTPEQSTTFTSNTTTPKQTTSFISPTTFLNQTSRFTSQLATPESAANLTSNTSTPESSTTFTSNTATPKQTTSFTSPTTFLNQTSSFTSQLVTPEPISNSSLHTSTPEPSTTFTSNTTTPKQTTSFTSLTTFLNQTSNFISQLVTPESTTKSIPELSNTFITNKSLINFPTHTTTPISTTSFTSHLITFESTTTTSQTSTTEPSYIPHTTTPEATVKFISQKESHNPTTSLMSDMTTDGYTDPSKASKVLDNLQLKMEEMEKNNKSNAEIVMGDVIGLLHVQAKNTETKDIKICYSLNHAMAVESQSVQNTNCFWSVKISKEAFDKSCLENNGSAFVGVLRFRNIGNKNETNFGTILNNEVYGVTMRAKISNLTNNIDMSFTQSDQTDKASCVSWDGIGELNWTTFGCETEIINNTIKCSCSHLTFFAVLMIPQSQSDTNITAQDLESLTMISSIGCGISIFFISIALFMHFLLRKAKSNQATKILMNMFGSLFLLNASFLSNESVANTQDNAACVFIALLLHYSMLASFTWFFIQALHMYLWLIRQNITITNYMRKITVLGWACPAPIVVAIASAGGYESLT